jgi:hypothetical protein
MRTMVLETASYCQRSLWAYLAQTSVLIRPTFVISSDAHHGRLGHTCKSSQDSEGTVQHKQGITSAHLLRCRSDPSADPRSKMFSDYGDVWRIMIRAPFHAALPR